MVEDLSSEWKNYQFGITYSVTLNRDDLETSLAIRNTGDKDWEFQTLFHTYLAVDVSSEFNVPLARSKRSEQNTTLTADNAGYIYRLNLRSRVSLL